MRHNDYQRRYFDSSVDLFLEPIPEDVLRRTARIVAASDPHPSDRVLDVGIGTGALIPALRRRGVRDIVGCDLSRRMLDAARRRHPDVRFWRGDVIDFPRELGVFDLVFFNAVFANLWDPRRALQVTCSRLVRGGRIVISHPMGAAFVRQLAAKDSALVPGHLPSEPELACLTRYLPLVRRRFQDRPLLYLCVLVRR